MYPNFEEKIILPKFDTVRTFTALQRAKIKILIPTIVSEILIILNKIISDVISKLKSNN